MKNILDYFPDARRKSSAEYCSPCPKCKGTDRFCMWPADNGGIGRFWCRRCNWQGDAIDYAEYRGMSRRDALVEFGKIEPDDDYIPSTTRPSAERRRRADKPAEVLTPPCAAWQGRAWQIAEEAATRLWSSDGARALEYLRGRGLSDTAIRSASLGYHPADTYEAPAAWGIERDNDIYIPRGITIPWVVGDDMWRLNVRRPTGDPKYIGPAGWAIGLYYADVLRPGEPVALLEGEFDALTLMDSADIRAVATGSTSGSRKPLWIARLALASVVLVAYDNNDAGEDASTYWLQRLPNARRWRPYWSDVNKMRQDGADVKAWAEMGVQGTRRRQYASI